MKFQITVLLICGIFRMTAQNNVGIGTATPAVSAILDVSAANRGFLVPRLTSIQRLSINNPANGLLVFDTDSSCFFFYSSNVIAWLSMCSPASNYYSRNGISLIGNHFELGAENLFHDTYTNTSGRKFIYLDSINHHSFGLFPNPLTGNTSFNIESNGGNGNGAGKFLFAHHAVGFVTPTDNEMNMAAFDTSTGEAAVISVIHDNAQHGYFCQMAYDFSSGSQFSGSGHSLEIDSTGTRLTLVPGSNAGLFIKQSGANVFEVNEAGYLNMWSGQGNIFSVDVAGNAALNGDLFLRSSGSKIHIKEGVNSSMGVVAFTAGFATVFTSAVTANSRVLLSLQNCNACGTIYLGSVTPSVSFTISSTSNTDASSVLWLIIDNQ